MVPGHVDKIIDARHPAEIEPHPNEMADIVRLIDEYEANQKAPDHDLRPEKRRHLCCRIQDGRR
jgi:hypothetical protein